MTWCRLSWVWLSVPPLLCLSAWVGGRASGQWCIGSTLVLSSGWTILHLLAPVSSVRWGIYCLFPPPHWGRISGMVDGRVAVVSGASPWGIPVRQKWRRLYVVAERCSDGCCSQMMSYWASGAPVSSASLASAGCSSGYALTASRWAIDSLARLDTVYVTIQNYGEISMYLMVRERWNPTSCGLLEVFLGMRKVADTKSSILNHNLMKVSSKSTLLR